MVKCPKCGAEIKHLGVVIETKTYLEIDKDGNYKEISEKSHTEFYCPECQETLFDEEKDAIEFLNGKKRKSWGICVYCGSRAYEETINGDSGYYCKNCKKFVPIEINKRDWKWGDKDGE
jgi:predicted RNA-binding Zn-ribbon protein involved in translation (DUF1610 family)